MDKNGKVAKKCILHIYDLLIAQELWKAHYQI